MINIYVTDIIRKILDDNACLRLELEQVKKERDAFIYFAKWEKCRYCPAEDFCRDNPDADEHVFDLSCAETLLAWARLRSRDKRAQNAIAYDKAGKNWWDGWNEMTLREVL